MCLYQREAGNQKLFSFHETRLLFSRILKKEMKKLNDNPSVWPSSNKST